MKKKIIKILLGMLISFTILFYLYIAYENIEIEDNYEAKKVVVSTPYEQTVDNSMKKSTKAADIIEEINKSVCGISKLKSTGESILSMATESELGLGTGIVVSENGYILSNSHVTGEKYSKCYITIEDKETYTGKVVWSDTDLDLSITKIDAKGLKNAKLGSAKNVRVGESVFAIGNPIGYAFRRTVTSGIISATNRTIKIEEDGKTSYMTDLIQTDATINPGNSGGPLISVDGGVIGINSVKITSAEGIGFSVPIDVVKPIINSFIETDNFEEANLGIFVYDENIASYLNLKNRYTSGIFVEKIIAGGPAFGKGLKEGDIISKIDGKDLETVNDLREYIYTKKPGETVTLSIVNGRNTKEVKVELGKK